MNNLSLHGATRFCTTGLPSSRPRSSRFQILLEVQQAWVRLAMDSDAGERHAWTSVAGACRALSALRLAGARLRIGVGLASQHAQLSLLPKSCNMYTNMLMMSRYRFSAAKA